MWFGLFGQGIPLQLFLVVERPVVLSRVDNTVSGERRLLRTPLSGTLVRCDLLPLFNTLVAEPARELIHIILFGRRIGSTPITLHSGIARKPTRSRVGGNASDALVTTALWPAWVSESVRLLWLGGCVMGVRVVQTGPLARAAVIRPRSRESPTDAALTDDRRDVPNLSIEAGDIRY